MSGGTSAGDPAELRTAGDAMRDLSNVLARLVEFGPVNTGGAVEEQLLRPGCGGTDGGLGEQVQRVAQAVVSHLMSASEQTEDGALLLYAVGKAFVRSDTPPDGAALTRSSYDKRTGVTYYVDNAGDGGWARDSSGQWLYDNEGNPQVGAIDRPHPKAGTEPVASGRAPTAEPTTTSVIDTVLGAL